MPTTLTVPAAAKTAAAALAAKFTNVAQKEFRGELTLTVNRAQFHDIAAFLRDQLGYTYLIDVSSVITSARSRATKSSMSCRISSAPTTSA